LKKADGEKLKLVLMNNGVNITELFEDGVSVIEYELKDTI
jgi:hypothetical protein